MATFGDPKDDDWIDFLIRLALLIVGIAGLIFIFWVYQKLGLM